MAAVGRHQGIPCRLGFADVTNHLSTARLRAMITTDLFVYHGYTEMYLSDHCGGGKTDDLAAEADQEIGKI